MTRYAQGVYKPVNPQKYAGKRDPRYRSSWELAFMRFCDNNDYVLQWVSESISIPYRHPLTGKMTMYVPDFLITYCNKRNEMKAELIEIKPRKQSVIEGKMKDHERAVVAVNYAKWAAAQKWASRNGMTFRVITEDQLFRNGPS
jgi:DNA-binding transcriptional regulator of glucitol operon